MGEHLEAMGTAAQVGQCDAESFLGWLHSRAVFGIREVAAAGAEV